MTGRGPFGVEGMRAVVTGAGQGIGFGIAQALIEGGAEILVVDRDEQLAHQAVDRLGGSSRALVADLTGDSGQIALDAAEQLGGIDLLVNNAGVYPHEAALDLTAGVWTQSFDLNARTPAFLSVAVAKQMIAQGKGGSIVNIGSNAALRAPAGMLAYSASKAALVAVTQALAKELAPHGVRVNCIHPGPIDTGGARGQPASKAMLEEYAALVPLGRIGQPRDIAHAVVFLASPAAGFVTGVALSVDGGILL